MPHAFTPHCHVRFSGGLPKDDVQAVEWYRKAAVQGNAQAQAIVGSMYGKGEGGLPKDDAQAVEWYGVE